MRNKQHLRDGETALQTEHLYDGDNRLTKQSWAIYGDTARNTRSFSEAYTYNTADGSLKSMTTGSGDTVSFTYDSIKRLSAVTATGGGRTRYSRSYTYYDRASGGQTTLLPKVTYTGLYDSTGAAKAVSYTHAFNTGGYLTKVTEADNTYWAYSYDKQGQLKFATEYNASGTAEKRYKYYYDNVGNITSWLINNDDNSETYESHTYTYGDANWVDLLTAFDGQTITYDYAGNPTSYYNGTRWNLGWKNGRWLVSASSMGNTISYTYDANSLRTSKTVNGTIHSYLYAGGKLLQESTPSYTLYFTYQSDGTPYSMTYVTDASSATYYYIVNLQGDVMYLIDSSSKIVATYTYDPYGQIISSSGTMAEINPLRYRGYYYDAETGFYYLQTRYYDPAICRFINADSFTSTGQSFIGYNMFVYCGNNPITCIDESGTFYSSTEIHNAVLRDIQSKHPTMSYTGTYMRYKIPVLWHTYGFCDLYDTQTGEVWEAKRFGGGVTCSKAAAYTQLSNYVHNGILQSNTGLKLKIGGTSTHIDPNMFMLPDKDGEGIYSVGYWDAKDGIIYYDYTYIESQSEIVSTVVGIAAICVGFAFCTGAVGALTIPMPF